jgi:hypothetical protein
LQTPDDCISSLICYSFKAILKTSGELFMPFLHNIDPEWIETRTIANGNRTRQRSMQPGGVFEGSIWDGPAPADQHPDLPEAMQQSSVSR